MTSDLLHDPRIFDIRRLLHIDPEQLVRAVTFRSLHDDSVTDEMCAEWVNYEV